MRWTLTRAVEGDPGPADRLHVPAHGLISLSEPGPGESDLRAGFRPGAVQPSLPVSGAVAQADLHGPDAGVTGCDRRRSASVGGGGRVKAPSLVLCHGGPGLGDMFEDVAGALTDRSPETHRPLAES